MQRLHDMRSRYRDLVAEYGMVAVVFHLSVFTAVGVGGACAFLFGYATEAPVSGGTLGAVTAGYALTQVTSPLRYMLTFAVTPFVANAVRAIRDPEA